MSEECDNIPRMKKLLCTLMACVCACTAQAEVWALRLPETGLMPSYAKASFMSRMHERHGGSHLGMQDYTLNIPFNDPRRSHLGSWYYSIQGTATVSIMDVGGALDLSKDELMVFGLPITLIHPVDARHKGMITVMPRFAGDGLESAHAWDLPVVVDYSVRHSEVLSYSVGIAASPRFAAYAAVPYVSFSWQATPEWLVRMHGFELAALYAVNSRLQVGPSLSVEGGTWMVDRPEGQRIFRVRSLAAAMRTEYNFAPAGKTKRLLSASVGSTLMTAAQICRRTADKDPIETRHYKPGLFVALEVDFRF